MSVANFKKIEFCLYDGSLGLIDLAIKRNSLIGGDDFKSGQTKIKSVLVDFLVGAGIKVSFFFFFLPNSATLSNY